MSKKKYLKNLGSGNGFMLDEKVFLYAARRSYLYPDKGKSSSLEPPKEFMSKQQVFCTNSSTRGSMSRRSGGDNSGSSRVDVLMIIGYFAI